MANDVMREDHPARHVVAGFWKMRESCDNYTGIKDDTDGRQCLHDAHPQCGNWCAMDCCPLLRERARAENVGWD